MANVDSTPELCSAKENFLYFHQVKSCNSIYRASVFPVPNFGACSSTFHLNPTDFPFIFVRDLTHLALGALTLRETVLQVGELQAAVLRATALRGIH